MGDTTTVGSLPDGASPYGCLDMAGNVWEWTRSLWGEDLAEPAFKYPYDPKDGRENLRAGRNVRRVVRGGSFHDIGALVRCSSRGKSFPGVLSGFVGFRVIVVPE